MKVLGRAQQLAAINGAPGHRLDFTPAGRLAKSGVVVYEFARCVTLRVGV
ncbi:hypothetical protein MSM1_20115 [Mycobacterium sp. SM1]|nr:hypothetical protein [Mycobacterium sp. SM1]MBS4730528.1 hypothetical protein [Mycobacterium sp. SM1]